MKGMTFTGARRWLRDSGPPLLALLLILAWLLAGCGLRPKTGDGQPSPQQQAADAALRHAREIGSDLLQHAKDLGLELLRIGVCAVARCEPSPTGLGSFGAQATAGDASGLLSLELVRPWKAPVPKWDRVRLAEGSDGQLLVTRPERGAATLEDASGRQLERVPVIVAGKADFFQARQAGGHLLVRSKDALTYGGAVAAPGPWETSAGLGSTLVAWQPCHARPCPASVIHGAPAWQVTSWPVELFGASLAQASTGTVAIGSREQPNSSGWTYRQVDAAALASGRVVEVPGTRQTWRPDRGISLEDPQVVPGSGGRWLVGGSYDLAANSPSGRIYLAEAGGGLRIILTAAPSGNDEPGAVVHQGVLYVVAERGAGQSGLWRYVDRQGLQLAAVAPGERPSVASSAGRVWVSTTRGLFALPP